MTRTVFFLGLAICFSAWPRSSESLSPWSFHAQATLLPQGRGDIHSPYEGMNSLQAKGETRVSSTNTLFLGRRLWKDAQLYLNPEATAGTGLSFTEGIAAFPNGEVFRVGTPNLRAYFARAYLHQTIRLGTEDIELPDSINQVPTLAPARRLSFTLGKFSLNDVFDLNQYSHDPRTQFLNWVFMDNGAWDYAADTRGYTWGLIAELQWDQWAIRFASALVPTTANGLTPDVHWPRASGNNLEVEYRYRGFTGPGAVRFLMFANSALMDRYDSSFSRSPATLLPSFVYRIKYGFGIGWEHEIGPGIGVFLRVGWNDGRTQTWAFTEIDEGASLGLSLSGGRWGREKDVAGVAFAVSGLSADHAKYLRLGGMGFILGDGTLSYGPECVAEAFYAYRFLPWATLSADFQGVLNPGFNTDRGPVAILAGRLHLEI